MSSLTQSRWLPFLLLICSNIFMTFAWYGNLKYARDWPLWKVIPLSWSIALFEYVFMIPANRWGIASWSLVQLKIAQEVITLLVFSGFAILYFKTAIRWNHLVAFALVVAAVGFAFLPGPAKIGQ